MRDTPKRWINAAGIGGMRVMDGYSAALRNLSIQYGKPFGDKFLPSCPSSISYQDHRDFDSAKWELFLANSWMAEWDGIDGPRQRQRPHCLGPPAGCNKMQVHIPHPSPDTALNSTSSAVALGKMF